MKQFIKQLVPRPIIGWYWRVFGPRAEARFAQKTPKEAFTTIYERNLWGEPTAGAGKFNSGTGSRASHIVDPYISALTKFLGGLGKNPDVVDLGCGDFFVGTKIRDLCARYIACDVVESLIDYNKRRFAKLAVDFRCVDITVDALPSGEIVLVRQVLQHLSNAHIAQFLAKLGSAGFGHLILTEHLPSNPNFVPNLDKPVGPSIRLGRRGGPSGVVITAPPFNFPVKGQSVLCECLDEGSIIRTTVYEL